MRVRHDLNSNQHTPCCREDIDTIKAFGSVHLRQHLVNNTIRDTGRIVTSAPVDPHARVRYVKIRAQGNRYRRTAWER